MKKYDDLNESELTMLKGFALGFEEACSPKNIHMISEMVRMIAFRFGVYLDYKEGEDLLKAAVSLLKL